MALETHVAGAYYTTYNAVAIGYTTDGFTLTLETKAEIIDQTDQYGDTIIDGVVRGGNCYIDCESKVFKAGSITPFYPFGSLGVISTAAAPIGRMFQNVASALVMTAVANLTTVGNSGSITTLTASKAILPPNSNLKLLFTSKLRTVPIRLLCLPSDSGGSPPANVTCFTTT